MGVIHLKTKKNKNKRKETPTCQILRDMRELEA